MRRLLWIPTAAILAVLAACAGAPRQKPVPMGPVDTGEGSLEAARRELHGSWSLVSLEAVDASGARHPVQASGVLSYDEHGNLKTTGTIDDPRLQNAIPIDFTGRIVIDPVKRVFYPADLVSSEPVDSKQLAPVGLDKVRQYSVTGDTLVVTYLDAAGKPTAVLTWRKR